MRKNLSNSKLTEFLTGYFDVHPEVGTRYWQRIATTVWASEREFKFFPNNIYLKLYIYKEQGLMYHLVVQLVELIGYMSAAFIYYSEGKINFKILLGYTVILQRGQKKASLKVITVLRDKDRSPTLKQLEERMIDDIYRLGVDERHLPNTRLSLWLTVRDVTIKIIPRNSSKKNKGKNNLPSRRGLLG